MCNIIIHIDPYFSKVPEIIEAMIGQTAILSCKVENLQDKMVRRFVRLDKISHHHVVIY